MESPQTKTSNKVQQIQQGPMQAPRSKQWLTFWKRAKLK